MEDFHYSFPYEQIMKTIWVSVRVFFFFFFEAFSSKNDLRKYTSDKNYFYIKENNPSGGKFPTTYKFTDWSIRLRF